MPPRRRSKVSQDEDLMSDSSSESLRSGSPSKKGKGKARALPRRRSVPSPPVTSSSDDDLPSDADSDVMFVPGFDVPDPVTGLPGEVAATNGKQPPPKPRQKPPAEADDDNRIIVETAFDTYFKLNSTRSQTSDNVFSDLVPPLSAEEYAFVMEKGPPGVILESRILSEPYKSEVFSRILLELKEGFNVLCYGYGSKRNLLNDFAITHCAKLGHVVVVNAFKPDFSIRDMLDEIERVPGLSDSDESSPTSVDARCRRIYKYFSGGHSKRHLFLIIHNIDSATFRAPKNKACLAMLALNLKIHIVASFDHINAPLMWSSSEVSTRKDERNPDHGLNARGFAWLWHDMTTLEPYDYELAHVDKSNLFAAHGGGPKKKVDPSIAVGLGAVAMTETAAQHILASVTQRAKKLFVLLGKKQLQNIGGSSESGNDLKQFGLGYDMLFNDARQNFVATNDTAFKALLGEFRDHGLVLSAPSGSGGGEILWIPLRKERLASVLGTIEED